MQAAGVELNFVPDRCADLKARNDHEGGWSPTFDKLDNFLAASR